MDKSPRFLDAKSVTMPGLMFMVNDKEGQSNALMLKKKMIDKDRKVREQTIFVAVPEGIR